jgi:hypothetical protein
MEEEYVEVACALNVECAACEDEFKGKPAGWKPALRTPVAGEVACEVLEEAPDEVRDDVA